MKGVVVLRILFVIFCGAAAYFLIQDDPIFSLMFGSFVGLLVVLLEVFFHRLSLKGLATVILGIFLGLLLANICNRALSALLPAQQYSQTMKLFITFIFVYLGIALALKGSNEFSLVIPYVKFRRQELREEAVIVDTSSIIDGRILDIVKTGFVESKFIIPRFILNELHALADSTDHFRRQKGKRGIEILHSLKKQPKIEVIISDEDVKGLKSVDEKIVKLAQDQEAKVLTTDYNLNRIAQLQGVGVLNINDLANALKPIFIAGERFPLKLVKEGKEHNQAVGYLEDGTMVVVENARRLIGKTVNIEVSSVLQNPSGRIVFTKLMDNNPRK